MSYDQFKFEYSEDLGKLTEDQIFELYQVFKEDPSEFNFILYAPINLITEKYFQNL